MLTLIGTPVPIRIHGIIQSAASQQIQVKIFRMFSECDVNIDFEALDLYLHEQGRVQVFLLKWVVKDRQTQTDLKWVSNCRVYAKMFLNKVKPQI